MKPIQMRVNKKRLERELFDEMKLKDGWLPLLRAEVMTGIPKSEWRRAAQLGFIKMRECEMRCMEFVRKSDLFEVDGLWDVALRRIREEEIPLPRAHLFKTVGNALVFNQKSPPGRVYFIQDSLSKRIKIGCAKDVWKRMTEIQVGCPGELHLLGVVVGHKKREKEIHQQFSDDRVRGEWFDPTPELLEFIEENAEPWQA